jgi:predicted aspartyl protease
MPIIPIILYGTNTAISVEAYVDSGATFSVFSHEIAKELRINLKNAREQYLVVGDGGFIPSRVIKIPVQIGSEKFISDIAFSERLNIGFNLIGRQGIFEYFDEVIFNEKRKEVSFRWKVRGV